MMPQLHDLTILYTAGLAIVAVLDMARRVVGIALPFVESFFVRLVLAAIVPLAFGLAAEHAARATLAKDAAGPLGQPAALRQLATGALTLHFRPAAPSDTAPYPSAEKKRIVATQVVKNNGFSGLARIDAQTLVGVKDEKNKGAFTFQAPNGQESNYIFRITKGAEPVGLPLKTATFPDAYLPNDLESVCVLPATSQGGEALLATVLAAESSYYQKRFGRVFRIELTADAAYVTGIAELDPEKYKNVQAQPQYEGMICRKAPGGGRNAVQIILARRDMMEVVAFDDLTFQETKVGGVKEGRSATLTNQSPKPECTTDGAKWRDFGELYFDDNTKELWATSSFEVTEAKNTIQVCSAIYRIDLTHCGNNPFKLFEGECSIKAEPSVWSSDAIRFEGLTQGPAPNTFSASTDQDTNDFVGDIVPAASKE